DVFGTRAALLSAVAYMYAPFHLYDMFFRGHLPGAWAMVLFPLVLWAFRRLIIRGGARYFVLGTSLYAASFLTHNPAHLIFTPFLLFYSATLVGFASGDRPRAALRVGAAVVLASGLAAFFWIPALWDRQFIQLERMVSAPEVDYSSNFIAITDLLGLSPSADTGLMNPGVPNILGLPLVALSITSILGLCRHRPREERVHTAIFLCGLAGVVFMVLPVSAPVWERIPMLRYLMFPHRFLRLGSLVMAVLCGAATRLFALEKKPFSLSLAADLVAATLIIVCAFPILYPPYYDGIALNPDFAEMMEFERSTGTIGTTSFGEYLPIWVQWVPSGSPLEPMYQSSGLVERLEVASLPTEATVASASYGPMAARVDLHTPTSFTAVFNTLYFPGWRAYVDGQETQLAATYGSGLLTLPVPAGEHTVELRFERTAIRAGCEVLSVASGLILATVCICGVAGRRGAAVGWLQSRAEEREKNSPRLINLSGVQATALTVVAIGLTLAKVGILDRYDTFFKHDFGGLYVRGAQHALDINFGGQITLLGYNLSADTAQPGQTLDLTLYWKAQRDLPIDYSAFVHLVDEQLNIYAQKDRLHPGGYPTHLWPVDEYNRDSHQVFIPPGTPPGEYVVGVGLYDPTTMTRLPLLADEGHHAGMYFLQTITVEQAESPPSLGDLGIAHPLLVSFDNGMTLLGFTAERDQLQSGDFYRLALFWLAEHSVDQRYSVGVRFLGPDGEEVLSRLSEPSADRYPTTEWSEGEIVRDNHSLWVPRDFPAGEYDLQVAVLSPDGAKVPASATATSIVGDGWIVLSAVSAGR
ncbi:MAG: YfhO family protein, partial [Anaerolineae bacterium]|nr:YfhO family protein [Anaerolineae bacterium]